MTEVILPWWLLAVPYLLAIVATRAKSYLHRRTVGHCQHCGYDLRATPDRCPEGGTPAKSNVPPGERRA